MSIKDMKEGKWNAARMYDALGRIGYTPMSALLDLCDNSVSANSSLIKININLKRDPSASKAIIDNFEIYDNGFGMDEQGLDNALTFGSPSNYSNQGTLSKFGLGLKSATSSLGKQLTIISRGSDKITRTAILDRDLLIDGFCYELRNSTKEEEKKLNDFLKSDKVTGTIVQIAKVRIDSLQSPSEINKGLISKAGVIFYYYLTRKKDPLELFIGDTKASPIDPLFINEIPQANSDLDETNWDGKSIKWILKPQSIQIDPNISGTISAVQLPHPPSVADTGISTQQAVRDKYMIGAGNYGVYIYRNDRLISWADNLDGMINQDQDLYSFRGRLEINSKSDDILNLDVTKSRIHLSEIAKSQLTGIVSEAKKKSIKAWNHAKSNLSRKIGEAPRDTINQQLDNIGKILEHDEELSEKVAPPEEQVEIKKRKKDAIKNSPTTKDEESRLKIGLERVQYVNSLEDNQLWQRALDPNGSLVVRVNQSHRLVRDILDILRNNKQLLMTIDMIFFALARAEYKLIYNNDFEERIIEKIMTQFREDVGIELSTIISKMNLDVLTE